jgi:hypothetical protein
MGWEANRAAFLNIGGASLTVSSCTCDFVAMRCEIAGLRSLQDLCCDSPDCRHSLAGRWRVAPIYERHRRLALTLSTVRQAMSPRGKMALLAYGFLAYA